MTKILKTLATVTLCCGAICAAQSTPSAAPQTAATARYFRLSFLLTYPDAHSEAQPESQTLTVDVPVADGHPGVAAMSTLTGEAGTSQNSRAQTLKCTDVHRTLTGLAVQITFLADSVTLSTGAAEPRQGDLTFSRQVDVALRTPTTITNRLKLTYLKPGDEKLGTHPASAPQITLTVTEL